MYRQLLTVATGRYEEFLEVTGESMSDYAEAIDAEMTVYSYSNRALSPHFQKFAAIAECVESGCKELLFVDADVFIKQNTPDIFDQYDNAAMNEMRYAPTDQRVKLLDGMKELFPFWAGLGYQDLYFNTGVMVLTGRPLELLGPILRTAPHVLGTYFEQEQLNFIMRLLGVPHSELGQKWNQSLGPRRITDEKAEQAYFLHGNGHPDFDVKLQRLKEYSQRFPRVTNDHTTKAT